ncbi:RICIN domain-containing protein [Streptomyces sp. NPDC004065]|uniref:RICIN domain-containing protein n=1 Tax=Streptomyces sp. NPDC004065 TaxID=3364689 RepID=UPI00384D7A84
MPTPHPAPPGHPPPAGPPGESDESLAARLRGSTDAEVAHSVALLVARHWQAVHDYAAICLASSSPLAAMATTAAFHQVFDRLTVGGPAAALRPRLLVTVRDTVRLWSADGRVRQALPELGKPAGGRGMRASVPLIPENRRLAEHSFEHLPGAARCLLWHTEVEGEPAAVPAALLGLDAETARLALEQAREKFHEGCVRAHRELAPTDACRHYNRLLDVPIRRGGALLPDVRRHLDDCRYCRDAAEQLGQVEAGAGLLLAEAVLGWGARRYVESRTAVRRRATRGRGSGRHGGGRPAGSGRRRARSGLDAVVRRVAGAGGASRALRTGAGLVTAGLLATVLGVSLWSPGGDAAPAAATGTGGAGATAPGTGSVPPSTGPASGPGTAGRPPATGRVRLRNVDAGLCLDVRGEVGAGAAARLAPCSAAGTQAWSLEDDGLLRSGADPALCLDSHADAGVVILGDCADADARRGPDVRYDLTRQGELLPRWEGQLALAAAAPQEDADIVVKVRDGTTAQRWLTDDALSRDRGPGSLSIAGTDPPAARRAGLIGPTT